MQPDLVHNTCGTSVILQCELLIIEMCIDMPNELDNTLIGDNNMHPKQIRSNDKWIIVSSLIISFNDIIIASFVIIELK